MAKGTKATDWGCLGCLLGGPLLGLMMIMLYVLLPLVLVIFIVGSVAATYTAIAVAGGLCLAGDGILRAFPSYRQRRNRVGRVVWPKRAFVAVTRTLGGVWSQQQKLRPQSLRPKTSEVDAVAAPSAVAVGEEGAAMVGVADELKKLSELRDSGVLTEEEFAARKAKLLAQ